METEPEVVEAEDLGRKHTQEDLQAMIDRVNGDSSANKEG
jgi:hypothetical protein